MPSIWVILKLKESPNPDQVKKEILPVWRPHIPCNLIRRAAVSCGERKPQISRLDRIRRSKAGLLPTIRPIGTDRRPLHRLTSGLRCGRASHLDNDDRAPAFHKIHQRRHLRGADNRSWYEDMLSAVGSGSGSSAGHEIRDLVYAPAQERAFSGRGRGRRVRWWQKGS